MVRIAAALLFLLLLAACLPFRSTPSPTQNLEAVYTAAAVTMETHLTLVAGQTAVSQLTAMAGQVTHQAVPPKKSTATVAVSTNTAAAPVSVITQPPVISTLVPPTAASQAPCDRAEWLGDVTVPADTLMPSGSVITKVWRVKNAGSCTWTPSYTLVFTGGNLPAVATTTFLPGSVPPGQIVELSVTVTTPASTGIFQSTWMLRNASGQMFGGGPNGADPLIARIRTFQPSIGLNSAFDLAAYYCTGSWRSGAGQLACPGLPQDANGSVVLIESPTIENRQTSGYGLWVRPNQASNGWISGVTPAYLVQSGDYFLAEIGCLQGNSGCDVVFELNYQIVNGASGQLGRWRETYDGVTTLIEIDLSDLSSRSINLVLNVFNNGQQGDANAIWLLPRIQQSYQRSSPALTWTRSGYYSRSSCDEIRVSFTGANTAAARAFDCFQGSWDLGQITLTADQVSQLSYWIQRLENSEGEFYSATQDRPVTTHIFLNGLGQRVATDEDLRNIEKFAVELFNLIVR